MKRFEILEPRLMLSAAPLVVEGFDTEHYAVGSQLSGTNPEVAGFAGSWTGSGSATISPGSLTYAGLGIAGDNRVQLNSSITVSREFAIGATDPLANYVDSNGDIGTSIDGSALYLSFLMQIDGTSPPASTFSLYNNSVSGADREFRILYSGTNSSFQAIAGPSGPTANLATLNNDTNLFVIKIEFSAGSDTISIWQNPVAGQAEPTPHAQFTTYDISFDRMAFTRFGGTGTSQFDELRIGSAWSAVTDGAALGLIPRPPIAADGFNSVEYASGTAINGVWSYIAGFDGTWNGAATSTIESGNLVYAGYGAAGSNRLQLKGTDVLHRQLLGGNNGPLKNYIDSNGDISTSHDDSPLYLSFLMQVDGASPPASTFSLYNDGITASDREFRILYSGSNSTFQAIVGPSGTAVDLGPLNNGTNLFVIKIEFSDGDDTISIWHNPTAGEPEPTPTAQITDYDIAFDRLAFTRFAGTGTVEFDELRIGSVWSAVTDEAALALIPGPKSIVAMHGPPPSPLGDGTYPSGYFPFIDEFGQYRYLEWDDKIHSVDELIQSGIDEAADLAANPGPADLNQYGGWLAGPQLEATGYFRTEKVNGKWWLVDPEGRLFFSNGITGVSNPERDASTSVAVKTGVTGRDDYFAHLPGPGDPAAQFLNFETSIVTSGHYQGAYPLTMNFFAANALAKYGADYWKAASQNIAHARLQSWGMNTIGAWSDEDVYLQQRTPYTMVLFPSNPSLINGMGAFPDYFDPAYLQNVKNRILQESGKTLDDPWNLGYYFHNELTWTRTLVDDINVGLAALAATSTQHAKIALRNQLMDKYSTIQNLNAQWQTSYASWSDFLLQRNVTPNLSGANADLLAFDQLYADQYFSATLEGMRDVAPNHLYLGARFTGGVRLAPAQASMEYADVVSINRYGPDANWFPPGLVGDVPIISGEYHYSANDTGLWSDGLRTAADQTDRAEKFSDYLIGALESDRYVGVHWLQYWDFPAAGKLNANNNNSNLGFVSITDTPYTEMVDAARIIGASLYETRIGDFAFVVDNILYITGTENNDQFSLSAVNDILSVTRNSTTLQFALSSFGEVIVSTGYGDDTLAISGLAEKQVTLRNASGDDIVNISSGNLTLAVETGSENVAVSVGESAIVELIAGTPIASLVNQGLVTLKPSQAAPTALTVGELTMGPTAVLDLANNGLVVNYTGSSPLAVIRSAIASAYNSGVWDGAGITTSYGDAVQSAIGFGESSVVLGHEGGTFMGQTVDATAVLIRHTLYGDANLSGSVDASDFNLWNANRFGSGHWTEGDFNYDGGVDGSDFNLWQSNVFTDVASVQPPIATNLAVSSTNDDIVEDIPATVHAVVAGSSAIGPVAPVERETTETIKHSDVGNASSLRTFRARPIFLSPAFGEHLTQRAIGLPNAEVPLREVVAVRDLPWRGGLPPIEQLLEARQELLFANWGSQISRFGDEDLQQQKLEFSWSVPFLPRFKEFDV